MEDIEEFSTTGVINGGGNASGKEVQLRKGFGGLVRNTFERLPLFMRRSFHYLWIPSIIGAGLLFVKPKVRIGNIIIPINIFGDDKNN